MPLEDKLRKLAETKPEPVDWALVKQDWLAALDKLYLQITEWMSAYEAKGYVEVRRTPFEVTEERLGTYKADALELDFSGQVVRFEPQGTVIVGGLGRLDVYVVGRRQQALMLIMSGDRKSPTWQIWHSKRLVDRVPFEKRTLEDLLDHWIVA